MTEPTITKINPAKVVHAYSGRPGCGCGCRGKHHYRPEAKGPGYEVERDDKAVDRVVAKMNKLASEGAEIGYQMGMVYIETETRYYWAYFS